MIEAVAIISGRYMARNINYGSRHCGSSGAEQAEQGDPACSC
jgi:hypothetical protein